MVNGQYELTGVSECQTLASCSGGADEVKTTIAYDASGNIASVSKGSGDNALVATHAATYDAKGDLLTVDGPLAGTADTVRFRYDAARRQGGGVSPDPDGAGPLKHRASRITYDAAGRATAQERGTVNSQSDADWGAFASAEKVEIGLDANGRPTTQKLVAGGTTYALTHLSYDALGRPECTAQRMNPAAFGSVPASACTPGTSGSFGPDRINKVVYDAAGQALEAREAVGTTDEAPERTLSYSGKGQVQSLKDGENNLTTYEYDGHDRLLKTRMPVPTKGANASSTTDYEQLGYDPVGNVISRRLRDGQSIALTYDNLDRPTL